MFEHRLGALLGLTLGQVRKLSLRELDRWQRYWSEECWGPHRDNLHAALIVTELLKQHYLAAGLKPPLMEDYMFKHPEDVAADKAKLLAAQAEIIDHQERRKARRLARGKKA